MYVIGDVHGCYKTLITLIDKLPLDEQIIFTGDLIDRGPSSKEVVQWVIDHSDKCRSVVGNHEKMLLAVQKKANILDVLIWERNGGKNTLDSYFPETALETVFDETEEDRKKRLEMFKLRGKIAIPQEHLNFFNQMPLYIEEGNLFVSHSGWNPQIPWDELLKDLYLLKGLAWFRGTPKKLPDNKFHIFGHTPVSNPEITDYYANIDTGAVFRDKEYGGKLTAIHYPSLLIYQQSNLDLPDIIIS